MLNFDGRVVLVTGAAHGIGAATARLFASAGASLALCDRDSFAFEGSHLEILDVRDEDAVVTFIDAVHARFGRVDVLVNNAGGTFHAPFLKTSPRGEETLIAE